MPQQKISFPSPLFILFTLLASCHHPFFSPLSIACAPLKPNKINADIKQIGSDGLERVWSLFGRLFGKGKFCKSV